ncbi:hypothetical protein C8J56DRAFT_1060620 [Mycena floridula]|nr:hypothetical protein C8J56DRAFT_1060620 [Mycena floridula]
MVASYIFAVAVALASVSQGLGFTVPRTLQTPRVMAINPTLQRRSIPALLRAGGIEDNPAKRAEVCAKGYEACSDGNGCCPDDSYCGTFGGKLGCCPNGETCIANPNQVCDYQGYTPCAGQDFCCPTGDFCYNDPKTGPQCLATAPDSSTVVIGATTKIGQLPSTETGTGFVGYTTLIAGGATSTPATTPTSIGASVPSSLTDSLPSEGSSNVANVVLLLVASLAVHLMIV